MKHQSPHANAIWLMLAINVVLALTLGYSIQRVLALEDRLVTSCERGNALRVAIVTTLDHHDIRLPVEVVGRLQLVDCDNDRPITKKEK